MQEKPAKPIGVVRMSEAKEMQILSMLRAHLPVAIVADRMKISERTVRRLIDRQGVNWVIYFRDKTKVRHVGRVIKEGNEPELWKLYHDFGVSYESIGHRFGRSKQAIQQALLKVHNHV